MESNPNMVGVRKAIEDDCLPFTKKKGKKIGKKKLEQGAKCLLKPEMIQGVYKN